ANRDIEALIVQPTLPRAPIIELARKYRLPSVSGNRAFADAGGLMSYAGSLTTDIGMRRLTWTRSSKGRNLPICPFNSRQSLSWSSMLKPAAALGITIPPALLSRADDLID